MKRKTVKQPVKAVGWWQHLSREGFVEKVCIFCFKPRMKECVGLSDDENGQDEDGKLTRADCRNRRIRKQLVSLVHRKRIKHIKQTRLVSFQRRTAWWSSIWHIVVINVCNFIFL